jgi:ribonuclease III
MFNMDNIQAIEEKFDIHFTNKQLLSTAFTHRSYINESNGTVQEHNERLEFLGDAVLEILVSEYLFNKFPEAPEGELTAYRSAVVKMESLAEIALELGFGEYLLMSKGEEMTGGRTRPYILANTFEAFLGALFMDQGIEACKRFLSSAFFGKIDKAIEDKEYIDSKSKLQEITQDRFKQMPVYKLVKEEGPDHSKTFTVQVLIKNKVVGEGVGKSKQYAQQEAAKDALQKLI